LSNDLERKQRAGRLQSLSQGARAAAAGLRSLAARIARRMRLTRQDGGAAMARRQSEEQKETVSRVMHEYKHGELRIRGKGPKVKSPKQAIAIALHETGATNQESPRKNKDNLRRTKQKERRGETAEARTEGKAAQNRTMKEARAGGSKKASDGAGRGNGAGKNKDDLYAEAKRRNIPGRSKMSKAELERALHH
jgi:hypothetical protein